MNIVTQLIGFIALALLLNHLSLVVLCVLILLASACLWLNKNTQYFRLLKRLKWFFIVTALLFAFNTPGEHLAFWAFKPSPSYEGLLAAATQILRLALMLAVISHILAVNTREQLIAGLYFLLQPLKCLKLDVERFVARLWLTLHYVKIEQEQAQQSQTQRPIFERFEEMIDLKAEQKMNAVNQATEEIVLEYPQFNWFDVLMLSLISIVLIATWLKAFA